MRAQALAVQQSLIGSVVCSRNCKSSLCSIWSCSRSSYPPYKLSSFLSYQFPMSFATKIPNPLFHQPFLKTVGSHSSASTPERFHFARPITFQKIPTKLISVVPPASSSQSSSVSLQPVEDLPPKLQEIVKLFQAVEQPKAKYEQLLFYGKNLKPLDAQYKTGENKVQGCVSQVWVRAYLDANKNVIFEADSDSVLTKGLAALLVQGLSGRPVDEIVRVSPDFAVLLGLQQSLTPSRNNGFLNMLKLMQKKALQLYVEAEKTGSLGHDEDASNTAESSNFGVTDDNGNENLKTGLSSEESGGNDSKAVSSDSVILGSRGMRIRERLERDLMPAELDVEDISYQHAGHAGVRGSDGETHFNVRVVSEKFEGKSLVKRHRLIYDLLQEELQSGLHALSIIAKTPSEVNSR
nr:sufE-like protein 1, chloroplastic/mitochondrial [Ipomoea batatas]